MTIAIHISVEHPGNIRDNYNFKSFTLLAAQKTEHHFIFIFDDPPEPELYLEPNCTPVILLPRLKNNLLRHYWYNFKIPSLLQRYNADVFVTGGIICSLRTNVPQCMVIQSTSLHKKSIGAYLNRYLPNFLKKAKNIILINPLVKDELQKRYQVDEKKIVLAPEGIDDLVLPALEHVAEVKDTQTGGYDYFIIDLQNKNIQFLIPALKAFSIFKKWQKSGMKLVLYVKTHQTAFIEKELLNYKFREHVHIISADPYRIFSAAYAAFIVEENEFPRLSLYTMKAGIPVITTANKIAEQMLSGSLQIPFNQNSIAEKMMLLYKDEHQRNAHIKMGLQTADQYIWKSNLQTLWDTCNAVAKV